VLIKVVMLTFSASMTSLTFAPCNTPVNKERVLAAEHRTLDKHVIERQHGQTRTESLTVLVDTIVLASHRIAGFATSCTLQDAEKHEKPPGTQHRGLRCCHSPPS
jgi:hypothetical protein